MVLSGIGQILLSGNLQLKDRFFVQENGEFLSYSGRGPGRG